MLKRPKLVFSFTLPRFFPDSNEHVWLILTWIARDRSHHNIFTTAKSRIFHAVRVSMACCLRWCFLGKWAHLASFAHDKDFSFLLFLWEGGQVSYSGGDIPTRSTCWLHPVPPVWLCKWNPTSYDLLYNDLNTSWANERRRYVVRVKRSSAHCTINASGHTGSYCWFPSELPVKPRHGNFSSNFVLNSACVISSSPCETATWKSAQDQSCMAWKWPSSIHLPDHSHIFQNKTKQELPPVEHLDWVYPWGDDEKQRPCDSC